MNSIMDLALRGAEEECAKLRRECDMRAADTINLCKEIDALNAKIEAVRDYADYRKKYSPCCRDIMKLLTGPT